jgi:hypothetical protein
MRILLIAIDAGILITDEVTRLVAGTPRPIYAASTEPAIVENPDVIVKSANIYEMRLERMEADTNVAQIQS